MKRFWRILFLLCFISLDWPCEMWAQEVNAGRIVQTVFDSLEQVQRTVPRPLSKHPMQVYIIRVNNQRQFDDLSYRILDALQTGNRNIVVKFKRGTYFFEEEHLNFINLSYPDADISFEGKGVVVVPRGKLFKDGDTISSKVDGESCFVDLRNNQVVSPWGEMMYADSQVEIIDASNKICRVKCNALKGFSISHDNMAYLDLTRWCRCYQYKITKIEDGEIYFYAHDLALDDILGTKDYNVNYDYSLIRKNPRIRLCNVTNKEKINVFDGKIRLSKGLKSVYLGDVTNFINIKNSQIHQLFFKGLSFIGNKSSEKALIEINSLKTANIEFTDCRFVGQRGVIMRTNHTDNVSFYNNYVRDNYQWGIISGYWSANAYIANNTFINNGTGLSYARCVSCFGTDYYVGHNTFKNFGYCAVSVGLPYGSKMSFPSRGIVEYNHIFYGKKYFEEAWKHTIIDGGAIYVWTQNERAIIRYNYIHDYIGMDQNRGIFCDDGSHHVAVYGNIIINTPTYHSIGARRVAGTEKANNKISFSERNNIDNFIAYNLYDGTLRFVGHEQLPNGCIKGKNVILQNAQERTVRHRCEPEVRNVEFEESDIQLFYKDHDDRGVIINKDELRKLYIIPCHNKIKNYLNSIE